MSFSAESVRTAPRGGIKRYRRTGGGINAAFVRNLANVRTQDSAYTIKNRTPCRGEGRFTTRSIVKLDCLRPLQSQSLRPAMYTITGGYREQ